MKQRVVMSHQEITHVDECQLRPVKMWNSSLKAHGEPLHLDACLPVLCMQRAGCAAIRDCVTPPSPYMWESVTGSLPTILMSYCCASCD